MTVPGKPSDDLAIGTLKSIWTQAQLAEEYVRYAIIIERAHENFSAYAPDLPGCVATGRTVEEVTREMREAIQFHLDSMREDGEPVPQPTSLCDYIEAEVPVAQPHASGN